MKKLRYHRGEMLLESLIAMLIIAMTSMMLAMAAASAMRASAQAAQINPSIISDDNGETMTGYAAFFSTNGASEFTKVEGITVSKQSDPQGDEHGELYYYEKTD